MNNFEEIIKQKVDQFEVPFNEAHWQAMEKKLHAAKVAQTKKNIFIAAGIISIIGLITYFVIPSSTETTNIQVKTVSENKTDNIGPLNKGIDLTTNETPAHHKTTTNLTENNSTLTHSVEKISEDEIKSSNIVNLEHENYPSNEIDRKPINETSIDVFSADFIVYNNRVCLGEAVIFEPIRTYSNSNYLWDFGDGTSSVLVKPEHVYEEAGNYSVSLTITNTKTGKSINKKQKEAVLILPLPIVDFTFNEEAEKHDANKLKYPYTQFVVKGDKSNLYQWNFGNGIESEIISPKIIFDKKGEYKTSLYATNTMGCIKKISKIVTINHPYTLYAPNAFSPNQDGENDVFMPKALLTWDIQFEMIVKNKVGDVIFKTTEANNGWNGKLNNSGIALEPGIYFWEVITYDADGISHQHVGKINLIK